MTAREELFRVASSVMLGTSAEVNAAIDAYARELMGGGPAWEGYLRKRFDEALCESGLLDPALDELSDEEHQRKVDVLVDRLLLEAGVA